MGGLATVHLYMNIRLSNTERSSVLEKSIFVTPTCLHEVVFSAHCVGKTECKGRLVSAEICT
jgi:hypothetical protein